MPDFFTVIDLDKLAAKLEGMGFVREGTNPTTGRADRAAPDDWPSEPDEPAEEDPWGDDEPRQETRSQSRSTPRSGGSGRSSGNRSGGGSRSGGNSRGRTSGGSRGGSRGGSSDVPTEGTHTDGVGKEWTFGLDDAPTCDHGMPAAEVTKPGAQWAAWACPKGFGKDYKNKCDLWEYQD